MDIISQFLGDPRLNGIAAICAILALILGLQRQLFGIVRVAIVITALAAFYAFLLNVTGGLVQGSPTDISTSQAAVYLALFSIFGIWAALDEYESWQRAIRRALLAQVPLTFVLMFWIQLLAGRWDYVLLGASVAVALVIGALAGTLTYLVTWLGDQVIGEPE